jgi:hypothetical protein
MVVVLPAPFGPRKPVTRPGRTVNDRSSTATWNLNVQYAIERICATAGGLTPRQWTDCIPQLQY